MMWFTVIVPASGQLVLDTDDGTLNDAAMQVYAWPVAVAVGTT
ncbi:MAG: hypothetical protein R2818_13170 [Flavobacteriales bacterium]